MLNFKVWPDAGFLSILTFFQLCWRSLSLSGTVRSHTQTTLQKQWLEEKTSWMWPGFIQQLSHSLQPSNPTQLASHVYTQTLYLTRKIFLPSYCFQKLADQQQLVHGTVVLFLCFQNTLLQMHIDHFRIGINSSTFSRYLLGFYKVMLIGKEINALTCLFSVSGLPLS